MIKILDDFVSEAGNVKRFFGNKVDDALNCLSRAGETAGAAARSFVSFANRVSSANRTDVGKLIFG